MPEDRPLIVSAVARPYTASKRLAGTHRRRRELPMPIREFYCPACETVFEELLRSADKTERVNCPSCGSEDVSRKISVFAARAGGGQSQAVTQAGGCGRCGDPDGPCGM